MGLYEERLDRIRAAVALEPVDKIPFINAGSAFNAAMQGVELADFLGDLELQCTTSIEASTKMGVDAVQTAIFAARSLSILWLSKVKVPGQELGRNELWQVDELELIEQEDYDRILEMGYAAWRADFIERTFGPIPTLVGDTPKYRPTAVQRFKEAGLPIVLGGTVCSPFETLCGGRTLMNFLTEDLFDMPEKLEKVFAEVHETTMRETENTLANAKGDAKPIGMWVGGWRGTPSTLGTEAFRKWSWPYMREYVDLLNQYGVIPIMHLDSNWNAGFEAFKELAPKSAIVALDGQSDIFLAKEIIGDRLCIMGDVNATMLAFGTEQEVFDYTTKLCREIGPTGYIVASGCDIPFNAKPENVLAMDKAVKAFAGR